MSNAAKMTLEERIVQSVKDDALMKLVGDEDAITELVTRALKEALLQPRRTARSSGYGTEETDSPVVAAARSAATAVAQRIAADILASPENRRLIGDAMLKLLPAAIDGTLQSVLRQLRTETSFEIIQQIRDMKVRGEI